jgi:hypothetical protein
MYDHTQTTKEVAAAIFYLSMYDDADRRRNSRPYSRDFCRKLARPRSNLRPARSPRW